jgi:pimeloyl-ACP methyl ester carboxylesterase
MTSSGRPLTAARAQRALATFGARTAFGALERAAPAYGARWAERLWFTVPSSGGRWRAEMPIGRTSSLLVNGQPVVVERWGTGPLIVLLHGWGGRRSDFSAFVGKLVSAGYCVVAIDAPGHGESERGAAGRRRSTILEFVDALTAVATTEGPVHAVVAHSIGCMAAAVAVREGLPVDRLVFVAPMADIRPYTREFASRAGFGDRIRVRMEALIERRVDKPLSFFDIPSMRNYAGTQEVLLVHDKDDRETPWTDSKAIEQSWPGARLVTTTGLGHRRILTEPAVLDDVIQFVSAERSAGAEQAS